MTADPRPVVLIVDDDRVNRAALAELLQDECRLLLAKDGPSALQRMIEEDVSLVLLDIFMPGMDGYEVLRRIKADHRTADVGVIFITGQSEEGDEERGLLLGAADYVSKPIRPAIVRARIRAHLRFARQRRELARLSVQDGLTGIANRRHFDEALERACRHATRTGEWINLAMIDVDHFKQYNDRYGHGTGDDALRQVARVLDGFARRPYDVAARYGGEEFVLLLGEIADFPGTLEQLRHAIITLELPHALSGTAQVLTISGGGIAARLTAAVAPAALLHRADALLYRAKKAGRNRILTEVVAIPG
ncbi:MAG TPA: diguanylate cyclase [Roseomonas sp.]|jgi:diguanylate cyclase (GGDEF)-like protein